MSTSHPADYITRSLLSQITVVHHKILGYPTVDMTPGIGTELSIQVGVVDALPTSPQLTPSCVPYQLQVATDVTSIVTLASTKLSALFFYHRVFCQRTAKIKRAFEMVLYTTMGLVTLWLIAFALLSGLQCGSHFSALWDGEAVEYCVTIDFLYAYVVSDVILDIWILALPVPQVRIARNSPASPSVLTTARSFDCTCHTVSSSRPLAYFS